MVESTLNEICTIQIDKVILMVACTKSSNNNNYGQMKKATQNEIHTKSSINIMKN